MSAEGAIGELVMIVDPIEETYPFSGNTEFLDPAGALTRAARPRAQNLRDAYLAPPRRASRGDPARSAPARLGHEHSSHRQSAGGDAACAAHAPFRAPNPAPDLRSA